MSLEDKIKALLEGAEGSKKVSAEQLAEDDEAMQNGKITAGKSKKLEPKDEEEAFDLEGDDGDIPAEGNKKNNVKTNPQPGAPAKNPTVAEHVDALAEGEELSEEFKTKAAAILEAAIADGVSKELNRLDEAYAQRLDEAVEAVRDELVEEIDGYLSEAVETWMQDNELALERGVKTDIVENFIDGLRTLFAENYIEVPDEKLDVLDEQAEKIDELTEKLNESISVIESLHSEVISLTKTRVMESVGDSLTDTDFEKFAGLCEGIEYTSEDQFEEKLKTIKENYFPKVKRDTVVAESDSPVQSTIVEGAMSHYVNALTSPLAFKR